MINKIFSTAGVLILSKLLVAISGIILAKNIQVKEYGSYSFILVVITVSSLVPMAGITNLLIREIKRFKKYNQYNYIGGIINWSYFYVLFISFLICITLYVLMFFDMTNSYIEKYFYVIFIVPLRSLIFRNSALLTVSEKPVLSQVCESLIPSILNLLLILVLLFFGGSINVDSVLICYLISIVSTYFISYVLCSNFNLEYKPSGKKNYKVKEWQLSLIPLALISIVNILNNEIATIFLGVLSTYESVAYFKTASQFVIIFSLFLSSINFVIMPKIARYCAEDSYDSLQLMLRKAVRIGSVTLLPVIVILLIFGEVLLTTIFTKDYIQSYPILVVLCFGQIANVAMGSPGLILNMMNREYETIKCLLISIFINIFLLVYLIPIYSGFGAAIAVSSSLFTWNILMSYRVYESTKIKTFLH